MENILNYYIKTNGSISKSTDLYDFLDNGGQVITNGGTFLIPTNHLYFIGNFNRYNDFSNFLKPFGNGPVLNGFDVYISRLLGVIDTDTQNALFSSGIIEATSDSSLLGLLIDNFDFSGKKGGTDLLALMDMGIIIYYDSILDNMVLCSVGYFLSGGYSDNIGVDVSDLIKFNYYGDW